MDMIKVPLFYGDDPERWVSWIERYCSGQRFSDSEAVHFAYGFVEDGALAWFNGEHSRSPFSSWEDFKLRLFLRFSKVQGKEDWNRRMRFLDRIQKFLDNEERLEKQNLGGEEMEESRVLDRLHQYLREDDKATKNQKEEIQTSGAIASHVGGSTKSNDPILEQNHPMTETQDKIPVFVSEPAAGVVVCQKVAEDPFVSLENLFQEEQSDEQKGTDAERTKSACQVFDQMIVRGKMVTNKRKKKRWKASLEIHERLEKHLSSGEKERTSLSWIEVWNGFCVNGKQWDVNKEIYVCQVFDKRSRERKKATRKRKKNKKFKRATRSKSKCGKVNHMTRQTQEEYKVRKLSNKSLMQRCKIVICLASYSHQVTEKRFLRKFTKKKKKRTRLEEHEREGIKHELVFAKLIWGHKTILKKLARWKKHKFKQKHNKQIVNLGNPKLDPELFEKGFNEWFKKKQGYERAYSRDDKLLQPSGLAMQNRELLAAKKRKRHQFRHKHKKQKNCKEGINEKFHWLYWIWLLLFTQRKNRKRRKKYVESQTRTREILCVVEMKRCSWERLVKLGKVRDKDDLSLCLKIGLCGNVELDNTKMNLVKSMGRKDLPMYLEREASLGRELMERGGNKRACALSLGNEITRAALEGKNKSLIWDDCDAERHDCERLVILLKLSSPYGEVTSTHIVCLLGFIISLGEKNKHEQTEELLGFRTAAGRVREKLPKTKNIRKKLQRRATVLAQRMDHLQQAIQGRKAQAGHPRHEVQFETGNWVFLKIQSPWARMLHEKLSLRFYRPLRTEAKEAWDNPKAGHVESVRWEVLQENSTLVWLNSSRPQP
uniref:Retrotransposon gag domain-containing protein n=3 Tax=Noccaea caerulescens TaxID=107243 RepID=A0A1J3FWF6_NOCCA